MFCGGETAKSQRSRESFRTCTHNSSERMPNRGKIDVSLAEADSLLAELPSPRDPKEAEDAEDRQRIKLHISIRQRIEEQRSALAAEGAPEQGSLIFSTDDIDEILDVLPPPPRLGEVRQRLQALRVEVLEGAVGGCGPGCDH